MTTMKSVFLSCKLRLCVLLVLNFAYTECFHNGRSITLSRDFSERSILGDGKEKLTIFCYDGEKKSYDNLWRTVIFRPVKILPSNFKLFPGVNEDQVEQSYRTLTESWFNFMPWPSDNVHLSLFNRTCVGVSAREPYTARIEIKRVDYWKLSRMVLGLFVFFIAFKLSRNVFLHYVSGVGFGLTASVLILIFILSRLIPKRSGALTLLFGGWAVFLYLLQLLWTHLQLVFTSYYNYFLTYIAVVGVISFVICYRYGPVTNIRTLNLIQWLIQLLSLLLIFTSSENQEFSMAIILVALCAYNFPSKWSAAFKAYWRRKFPPKIRLLTEEEYRDQMNKTTQESLNELRKFCRSPDCNSWKIVGRLKKPVRFASFIEGESHLLDDEILEYETSERYTTISSSEGEEDSS